MQAHTLGEVGNLGTVSLTVSSGTILPIFIEIGSYLTDKEKKSWHSFFLRHGVLYYIILYLLAYSTLHYYYVTSYYY